MSSDKMSLEIIGLPKSNQSTLFLDLDLLRALNLFMCTVSPQEGFCLSA